MKKNASPNQNLELAYKEKIKLSDDKKKDLLKLCHDKLIPDEHHPFYYELCDKKYIKNN